MRTRKLAVAPAAPEAAPAPEWRTPKEKLALQLGWRLEAAEHAVEKARAALAKDGNFSHALEWSSDAFRAAAELEVAGWMTSHLWGADSAEEFLAWLVEESLQRASHVPSSTSPSSNQMEREIAATFCRWTRELLRGWKLSAAERSQS